MSRQANPKVIGAFVIGAVALIVAGILVFGSGRLFKDTQKCILFFEGSVKGLNIGGTVDFKGVRVGTVREIKVQLDRKDLSVKIPVIVEIEPDRIAQVHGDGRKVPKEIKKGTKKILTVFVERGLRAQLKMQSFVTGQLYIDLDFYPDKPARFVAEGIGYPEIPTIPSNLEALSKTFEKLPLEEIAGKLTSAIEGIERFINSPDLKGILSSSHQAVNDVRALLHSIDSEIKPLAVNLNGAVDDARKLIRNVDDQVKPISAGIQGTTTDARKVLTSVDRKVEPLLTNLDEAVRATRGAIAQADKTLAAVEDFTGERSAVRYELIQALKELSAAARSLRVMADTLERHPEALLKGKEKQGGK